MKSYAKVRPTRFDGTLNVQKLQNPNYKKTERNPEAKQYLALKRADKLEMVSSGVPPFFKPKPISYEAWSKKRTIRVLKPVLQS